MTQSNDDQLVCTFRLLLDGKDHSTIAQALYDALGEPRARATFWELHGRVQLKRPHHRRVQRGQDRALSDAHIDKLVKRG